jgi:hypothetical protein
MKEFTTCDGKNVKLGDFIKLDITFQDNTTADISGILTEEYAKELIKYGFIKPKKANEVQEFRAKIKEIYNKINNCCKEIEDIKKQIKEIDGRL